MTTEAQKAEQQREHEEKLAAENGILQYFTYEHLPEPLASISAPFGDLARRLVFTVPRNPERTVALRKLLEAKDAAVRAAVGKY